jgi:hypothetical protein
MKHAAAIGVALFALMVGACSNTSTYPSSGSLIPGTKLQITPDYVLPLEKLVYWGGVAAVAYYVTDPLAPNWSIQEAAFPGDHYRLSLRMKRFYTGGAGESRVVFNRRADELMRKGGFDNYTILDYSEGLESSVIGSQRVSEGMIVLTRRTPADLPSGVSGASGASVTQGEAAPARSTVSSAENPRS